jgi:polyisoprenoid-binding protein YceI
MMIDRLLLGVFAASLASAAIGQETYVIEPTHSQPQFDTAHIGYSVQHGNFGKATGKITLDRAANKGAVDVSIDATSIHTIDPRLDTIVKSEKFFNVDKFPTITYKSSKVSFDGSGRIVGVDGELTMLGVTKPVSLQVLSFNCGENPFNKKAMCGAVARGTLKRSDFGMTTGVNLMAPSDEVTLTIPVEAYKEAS